MRIEGGTFTASAELALQLAGEQVAGAQLSASAPAGPARAARAETFAASALASQPSSAPPGGVWVVTAGKGEIQRPATGYALGEAQSPVARQSAAATSSAAAKATVSSPLDFLRDSRLTAEEKLVLLLAQQQKDVDKEIDTVIKKAEAKSAQKVSGGGGILGRVKVFDLVKSAVPALGLVEKAFGDGAINKAISQLGGPVLAAAATAFGAPQLAPLAMSYGPGLLNAALDAELPFGGSTGSERAASPNAPNAGTGSSTALDPVEVQRLTLLVNRQQQWASTVSNMLHGLHQTRMNVIQNLR